MKTCVHVYETFNPMHLRAPTRNPEGRLVLADGSVDEKGGSRATTRTKIKKMRMRTKTLV